MVVACATHEVEGLSTIADARPAALTVPAEMEVAFASLGPSSRVLIAL